jgi:Protein of unknown function (DUF1997)
MIYRGCEASTVGELKCWLQKVAGNEKFLNFKFDISNLRWCKSSVIKDQFRLTLAMGSATGALFTPAAMRHNTVVALCLLFAVAVPFQILPSVRNGVQHKQTVMSDSKRPSKGDAREKGAMFAANRAAKLINSFISMGDIFGQTGRLPAPPADATDPAASIALPLADTDEEAGARQLKRVTTSAKAATAVLVDGPFAELDFYMTKPVSQYMTLDDKLITRLGDSTFRLAVPLSTIVGLELTPTIDVVVDTSEVSRGVVMMRSSGSTLYGSNGTTLGASTVGSGNWASRGLRRGVRVARISDGGRPEWFEVKAKTFAILCAYQLRFDAAMLSKLHSQYMLLGSITSQ